MNSPEMLSLIEAYVIQERERQGIKTVDTKVKPEPSGEAFNEFEMLLERQLMTTAVGYGGWNELNDPDILEPVYRLVKRRLEQSGNS